VFFDQGSFPVNFFFLYDKVVKDSRLRLPFDEFSMGVLRTLNVAPTQFHPKQLGQHSGVPDVMFGVGFYRYHNVFPPPSLYSFE